MARNWIDQIIRDAQAAGAFDDLPGKGKPFADRNKPYDPGWWARNLVKREKINMVPASLQVRAKIEALMSQLDDLESEASVRAATERLNAEIAHMNARVTSGPATSVSRLDPERVIERWRAQRSSESSE